MDIIYDEVLQCYVAQIGDDVVCLTGETYEEAHEEAKAIFDMYF
jgi:predicted RNase H-like HicB family nuclease